MARRNQNQASHTDPLAGQRLSKSDLNPPAEEGRAQEKAEAAKAADAPAPADAPEAPPAPTLAQEKATVATPPKATRKPRKFKVLKDKRITHQARPVFLKAGKVITDVTHGATQIDAFIASGVELEQLE